MSQTKVKSGLISDQSITASKLDVTGNGNNGQVLLSDGDGSFSWGDVSIDVNGTGTANYISKWSDSDTLTNSVIYDDGTNVGIGTSSPNNYSGYTTITLQNGTLGGILDFESNSLRVGSLLFDNSLGLLKTQTAIPLVFQTNNTERMRIDSAGNVLINKTASESIGSVVAANLQIGTTGIGASIMSYANAAGPAGVMVLGHGRGNSSGLLLEDDVIGQIRFAAGDGTDAQSLGGQISVEVDGTASANDMPSRMVFSTTSDGSNAAIERMRITSTGSVGIGTTSPSAKLHIKDANQNGSITDAIPSWWGAVIERAYTSPSSAALGLIGGTEANGAGGAIYLGYSDNVDSNYIYINNNDVVFGVNGGERMRIGSSGNVGINESNPITKLDINSGVARTVNTKTYTQFLHTNDIDDFEVGFATAIKGGTTSADRYVSLEAASYQKSTSTYSGGLALALNPLGGNVGIGTSSPDTPLNIQASNAAMASNGIMLIQANSAATNNGGQISFGTTSARHAAIAGRQESSGGSAGYLQLGTRASTGDITERMRIDSSGRVGIGTSSLTEKLQVEGKIKLSGRNYSYGQENHHIELTEDNGSVYIGNVNQSAYIANGSYLGAQIYHINTTQTGLASIYLSSDGSIEFYASSFTAGSTSKAASRRALLQTDGDFHVFGDVIAYSTTVSDERLKDNITTIDNALDKVCELRGVEYDWNASSRAGQHDMGVIAQEVEKVFPFIVREKEMPLVDGNTYKTVDYEKLVGVLIEAVKELKQEIEILKSK